MNSRAIATLSGLLLILAGFYYLYEIRWTEKQKETSAISKSILDIETNKINRISIEHPNRGIVLERKGTDWFLVEPIKTQADTSTVERMIDTLADGSWEREINPLPDKLADFGLDEPQIEVALSVEGKPEPEKVLVGKENPTGKMHYIRVNQEDRVLMVYAHVKNALDKTPDDLRDKRILRFSEDAVARVIWQVDEESFSAEKAEDGWMLVEPDTKTIEGSKIRSLIWRLEDLKFENVFEKPKHSLSYYGLDKPLGMTRLLGPEGEVIGELRFGMKKEPSVSYYAQVEGSNAVFELSHDFVSDLPRAEEEDQEWEEGAKP